MSESIPAGPCRSIVYCTDFSENAEFAFEFAIDAARRRPGCVLHLLHVIPEPDAQFWKSYIYEVEDVDRRAREEIDEKIESTYRPRVPEEVDFRVEMRIGVAEKEILRFAREQQTDLVVLGRAGHSSLGKLLFGEVAERVVRKAVCPVLVVPMEYRQRT